MRKRYKAIKPILRFNKQGKQIARYINSGVYDTGKYANRYIQQVCRGERNTYKGDIWIRECDFSQEELDLRLSKANKTKRQPILAFDIDGKFIKRYNHHREVELDGFDNAVLLVCNNHRKTHGGLIWIKESEYTDELLEEKIKNATTHKNKLSTKTINMYRDDKFLDKGDINFFENKGFN